VIRLGIVGSNYGRMVQLPAFRSDPRCEVVALASTNARRTADLAREAGIQHAFGDWSMLVEHKDIDAVAIATPPQLQPRIALGALALGKPVFVEKPLAANLADAGAMVKQAASSGRPAMIDFEFSEIMAWQHAKSLLDGGAVGGLRHVIVTWNVENAATRLHLRGWKTSRAAGGGALGNFVCHCLHYLEWFCGPIQGLAARLSGLPGGDLDAEVMVSLAFMFRSGVSGSLVMSCASFLGSGHRLEFYGDDGTIMLINESSDYMRGFKLLHARRPAAALEPVAVEDPLDARFADGRIAPVARLAARFLDAIEGRGRASPGFAEGYRVQQLMDAAQCSHDLGRWIETPMEIPE
jgi:predicted dehydrogenase